MMWRKSVLTLLCVLILGVLWSGPAYADLVAYWPFDEGSGTVAADLTGNGYDGTVTGGATWVTGQIDGALQFNGSDAYVDAPHIPLDNRTFVVTAWINPGQTSSDHIFFSQQQSGSTNLSLHFRIIGGSGLVRMGFYSNDLDSNGAVAVGNWYHLVLWYNADTQERRIYINGELDAEQTGVTAYQGTTGNTHIGQWSGGEYFNGMIDDVQIYDHAISEAEVLKSMAGLSDTSIAQEPSPTDAADDVIREIVLEWEAGDYADTHDVYFGTSYDDVNNASRTNPMDVLVSQGQSGTIYAPDNRLEFSQTYYWRVDEVNAAPDNAIYTGEVWSFTVEPFAYAVEGIVATTNTTYEEGRGPELVVDGSGLNEDDQHATTPTTMWAGAPPADGSTPYIAFEFDRVYKLYEMLVWNYNMDFEAFLGLGIKETTIEYSEDGDTWTTLGDFELNQGPGAGTYTYNTVVSFDGAPVKYVRMNIHSSWGATAQFHGLSEVRFMYIPAHAREPQPADGATNVAIESSLGWRSGRDAASHEVYLGTDPNALSLDGTTTTNSYDPGVLDLDTTTYWQVVEVNEAEPTPAWTSDVWSFSTQEYVVIDDFESYVDDESDGGQAIWSAWIDGLVEYGGKAENGGSQVGHTTSPFAEQTIVHGGGQSMPLYFENGSASAISEADYAIAPAQNWNQGAIKSLSLWFHGQLDNTGQLYVAINGTKVVYDGDAADIARAQWQPWNIDLSTVGANLNSVSELSVGVQGAGSGVVYIDDIRLYAKDVVKVTPTDPDPAGLAAHYTFDEGAGTTVSDASGNGNTGTIVGDPLWGTGVVNGAMEFSGDDYVNCGNGDSLQIQDAITITAWIKVASFTVEWETILAKGDDSYRMARSAGTGNSIHFGCNGPTGDNLDGNAIVTTDTWRHAAVVFDGAYKYVYIDGVEDARAASTGQINISTYDLYIAENAQATGRQLGGLVDDIRIYNRALSPEELAGMAGRTTPVYVPF